MARPRDRPTRFKSLPKPQQSSLPAPPPVKSLHPAEESYEESRKIRADEIKTMKRKGFFDATISPSHYVYVDYQRSLSHEESRNLHLNFVGVLQSTEPAPFKEHDGSRHEWYQGGDRDVYTFHGPTNYFKRLRMNLGETTYIDFDKMGILAEHHSDYAVLIQNGEQSDASEPPGEPFRLHWLNSSIIGPYLKWEWWASNEGRKEPTWDEVRQASQWKHHSPMIEDIRYMIASITEGIRSRVEDRSLSKLSGSQILRVAIKEAVKARFMTYWDYGTVRKGEKIFFDSIFDYEKYEAAFGDEEKVDSDVCDEMND